MTIYFFLVFLVDLVCLVDFVDPISLAYFVSAGWEVLPLIRSLSRPGSLTPGISVVYLAYLVQKTRHLIPFPLTRFRDEILYNA